MADVAPFRGVRYNTEKLPDLADVVIPPYDVISPGEQEAFYEISPFNMVRLELGKPTPGDTECSNPHTRAAAFMREWRQEDVLIRDDEPAIYYYELDYTLDAGTRQTRYGFICVLRLEEFGSGAVRPHEKTFKAVKDERLGLMQSCHANLSPVFALYADPDEIVDRTLRQGRETGPSIHFSDRKGMEHRIWRVNGLNLLRQVKSLMQDKAIFIADGHHRYETALNYRSIQREQFPNAGRNASFEYIMMYLSNVNQGGLTILPTHRLIRNWNSWSVDSFLSVAREFFDITAFDATEDGKSQWHAELSTAMSRKEVAIGFFSQGARHFYLLTAKHEVVESYLAGFGISEALRSLDVVVLDHIILKHLLHVPEMFLSNENNIHFKHDFAEALKDVQSGGFMAGFFINPTRIEQVQEVANAGLTMPHKSTYFYPKVGSGLVINLLSPDEEIVW